MCKMPQSGGAEPQLASKARGGVVLQPPRSAAASSAALQQPAESTAALLLPQTRRGSSFSQMITELPAEALGELGGFEDVFQHLHS